jgi:hypothetical protein
MRNEFLRYFHATNNTSPTTLQESFEPPDTYSVSGAYLFSTAFSNTVGATQLYSYTRSMNVRDQPNTAGTMFATDGSKYLEGSQGFNIYFSTQQPPPRVVGAGFILIGVSSAFNFIYYFQDGSSRTVSAPVNSDGRGARVVFIGYIHERGLREVDFEDVPTAVDQLNVFIASELQLT